MLLPTLLPNSDIKVLLGEGCNSLFPLALHTGFREQKVSALLALSSTARVRVNLCPTLLPGLHCVGG